MYIIVKIKGISSQKDTQERLHFEIRGSFYGLKGSTVSYEELKKRVSEESSKCNLDKDGTKCNKAITVFVYFLKIKSNLKNLWCSGI